MFSSIDDVIRHYEEVHSKLEDEINFLPNTGYTISQIQNLQSTLKIDLHPSFIKILKKVNLDTVTFRGGVWFSSGNDYLQSIVEMNEHSDRITEIWVASCEFHVLRLDNSTGKIYAERVVHTALHSMELIANSFEDFLVILASISSSVWPIWVDRDKALRDSAQFLNVNNIQLGREFWSEVILNAA